jgi:hypothetical protein
VTTADADEGAAGAPAPFTQDQVSELVRGTLSEEAVAAVLKAFPRPSTRKRGRSTKQSPVALSEDELERLAAEGVTPSEVRKRLEASDRAATAQEPREAGDSPTRRPPGSGRDA